MELLNDLQAYQVNNIFNNLTDEEKKFFSYFTSQNFLIIPEEDRFSLMLEAARICGEKFKLNEKYEVEFSFEIESGASYFPEEKKILISIGLFFRKSGIETLGVLIHELRHVYQEEVVKHKIIDKENFAPFRLNEMQYFHPAIYSSRNYRSQPYELDAFLTQYASILTIASQVATKEDFNRIKEIVNKEVLFYSKEIGNKPKKLFFDLFIRDVSRFLYKDIFWQKDFDSTINKGEFAIENKEYLFKNILPIYYELIEDKEKLYRALSSYFAKVMDVNPLPVYISKVVKIEDEKTIVYSKNDLEESYDEKSKVYKSFHNVEVIFNKTFNRLIQRLIDEEDFNTTLVNMEELRLKFKENKKEFFKLLQEDKKVLYEKLMGPFIKTYRNGVLSYQEIDDLDKYLDTKQNIVELVKTTSLGPTRR